MFTENARGTLMALTIAGTAMAWPMAVAADPAGCQGQRQAEQKTATAVAEGYKTETRVRAQAQAESATARDRGERGHILWDAPLPQDPIDYEAVDQGMAQVG